MTSHTSKSRYCYRITHRGLSVAAQLLQENYGQPYLSKEKFEAWTDEAKLDILMQCFEQNFIDWQYRQDVNQQELYLVCIDHCRGDTLMMCVSRFPCIPTLELRE